MIGHPLALLFTSLGLVCGSAGNAGTCDGLKPEARSALQSLIAGVYQSQGEGEEDSEGTEAARRGVLAEGKAILPCLSEIFRNGPDQAGLWTQHGTPPSEGHWMIQLIQRIDPTTAVSLYEGWRSEVGGTDTLTRVHIDTELARLGDARFLPEMVEFLAKSPVAASDKQRVRSLQEDAIEVISIRNYRPALAVLRKFGSESGPEYARTWRWLPVYIAQLSDDTGALTRYASEPEQFSWALQAMKRLGRDDMLKVFANDQKYPYREVAQKLLKSK